MYLLTDTRAANAMGDAVRRMKATRNSEATQRRTWLQMVRARVPGHSRARPTTARVV